MSALTVTAEIPVLITVKDAARLVSVGASTVRQLIYDGKVEARVHGNKWLVNRASLLAWANSLERVNA